jgi:glycosyltransferase involved in cell wall biosynthesis
MNIDVVVPTYKRSALLRLAVESLLRAPIPAGVNVSIWIVDNNSQDDTEAVVRDLQDGAPLPVHYVFEAKQSSSYARNTGIASGTAEIVAFIDDDEEIDQDWFRIIFREFSDPAVDFIGGSCLGNWKVPPPAWLPPPPHYQGVISVNEVLDRQVFNKACPAIMGGGNGAVRRRVFEELGGYSTKLGRSATGLLSGEDLEFHERMVAAKMHGVYVPDMIIYHHIPLHRLTRNYYRRHTFWGGVSQGMLARTSKTGVVEIFGIPRFQIGKALRGLMSLPGTLYPWKPSQFLMGELPTWSLLGFIYGRFLAPTKRFYEAKG